MLIVYFNKSAPHYLMFCCVLFSCPLVECQRSPKFILDISVSFVCTNIDTDPDFISLLNKASHIRLPWFSFDLLFHLNRLMRKTTCFAKTKTQISFAVTVKPISAFVIANRLVQFVYFLNRKFSASSHLLCLYNSVMDVCKYRK